MWWRSPNWAILKVRECLRLQECRPIESVLTILSSTLTVLCVAISSQSRNQTRKLLSHFLCKWLCCISKTGCSRKIARLIPTKSTGAKQNSCLYSLTAGVMQISTPEATKFCSNIVLASRWRDKSVSDRYWMEKLTQVGWRTRLYWSGRLHRVPEICFWHPIARFRSKARKCRGYCCTRKCSAKYWVRFWMGDRFFGYGQDGQKFCGTLLGQWLAGRWLGGFSTRRGRDWLGLWRRSGCWGSVLVFLLSVGGFLWCRRLWVWWWLVSV